MSTKVAPACGICGHPKRAIQPPKKLTVWVCDNCDVSRESPAERNGR